MKYFYVFLIFILASCSIIPRGYVLSRFSLYGKLQNSYIVGRRPEYGDARPDGCIIFKEMYLSLKTVNSIDYIGIVTDVSSLKPLQRIKVKISFINSDNYSPITVLTGSLGKFHFTRIVKIDEIKLTNTEFRQLQLNFTTKTLL